MSKRKLPADLKRQHRNPVIPAVKEQIIKLMAAGVTLLGIVKQTGCSMRKVNETLKEN